MRVAAGELVAFSGLNDGIACHDEATESGYILYSKESVHTRFSDAAPHGSNADNFVCAVYNSDSSEWSYDNNSTLVVFTPVNTDLLVATVDFIDDLITSGSGDSGTVGGVAFGFARGDLVFRANRFGGADNPGEFGVTGSFFARTGVYCPALPSINDNDYSSTSAMQEAGWVFSGNMNSLPSDYASHCQTSPASSWYGFANGNAVGTLSVVLPGSGSGTVDFGNCHTSGTVVLYINDQSVASAPVGTHSLVAHITFVAGDTLRLSDEDTTIIRLNSIQLNCEGTLSPRPPFLSNPVTHPCLL